jgi:DNA-cytosine methyltransferase
MKKNTENGFVVLSLFNGMNTGRVALENLGIPVKTYYSSEIKKSAIKITQHHYSDTIQLGDVRNVNVFELEKIDLVLSGSPCKDLSVAGKRAGIYGENSVLFWEFIRILNDCKKINPNVLFLQENVGSARKKDVFIMSQAMGLLPVRINSSLVTAQLRDRYYWTNIRTREDWTGQVFTDIPQPKDLGIMFKDILTNGFVDRIKSRAILESEERVNVDKKRLYRRYSKKGFGNIVYQINNSKKSGGKQPFAQDRIYDPRGKCPALTETKASAIKVAQTEKTVEILTKYKDLITYENGQLVIKANTKKGFVVATPEDCINLSFPTSKTRKGRVIKGKFPTLVQTSEKLFHFDGIDIRPLNKVELCRLQGFNDNYCDILTRNQAAGLLGDGWTLPVIEHIFSFMDRSTANRQPSNNRVLEYA